MLEAPQWSKVDDHALLKFLQQWKAWTSPLGVVQVTAAEAPNKVLSYHESSGCLNQRAEALQRVGARLQCPGSTVLTRNSSLDLSQMLASDCCNSAVWNIGFLLAA